MFSKIELRRVTLSSAVMALAALSASAYAVEREQAERVRHTLEGDYAYTTVGYCVESAAQPPGVAGFDPQTLQLLTAGQVIDLAGKGTLHFKTDGTVTLTGTAAWVLPAQTAAGSVPVLTNLQQSSNVGTYVLGADGAINMEQTFRQDINASAFALVAPTEWEGVVIGRSVNLNIKQNVQTLQTVVNGNVLQENQVVCVQTLNASKVGD